MNNNDINYNQNLGNHIITTSENGTDVLYNKPYIGSRYVPDTPKDATLVYTQTHENNSNDKTKMVELIDEMHTPGTKYDNYLKNNRLGQFYFGSLAVVGLFIVYRMIQKTR